MNILNTHNHRLVFNLDGDVREKYIEKWTYNELDDLIYAFIKTANYNIGECCVSGYIELLKKTTFLENYLDSDIE